MTKKVRGKCNGVGYNIQFSKNYWTNQFFGKNVLKKILIRLSYFINFDDLILIVLKEIKPNQKCSQFYFAETVRAIWYYIHFSGRY